MQIQLIIGLTLSMLGNIFSRRHIEIFFFFSPDNLHDMTNPVFWKKKNINFSSVEFAQKEVMIKALFKKAPLKVWKLHYSIEVSCIYCIGYLVKKSLHDKSMASKHLGRSDSLSVEAM